jgi:hypothetical protein
MTQVEFLKAGNALLLSFIVRWRLALVSELRWLRERSKRSLRRIR